MDNGIKEYIAKQTPEQKKLLLELHRIITEAFPGIENEMKYGAPWYGGRYYTVALRGHVNLGMCIGGFNAEQLKKLEGTGKLMRHIKIKNDETPDEQKIVELLKMVKVSESRCGG